MDLWLPLMKASNLALLMLNCFVLHFDLIIHIHFVLMKELIWFLYDGWFYGSNKLITKVSLLDDSRGSDDGTTLCYYDCVSE